MATLRDVFVIDSVRTPIGRHRGALASVRADDLAAHILVSLGKRTPALYEKLDQVTFGATNQAGEDNRDVARMAVLLAGLPYELPAVTVNRLCGSGLEAVCDAVRRIATGEATIQQVGEQIFQLILDVASGRKQTWADHWGLHNEFALFNPAPIT